MTKVDWKPIETAIPFLRTLENCIERSGRGSVTQWGNVLVWSKKTKESEEGIYEAIYVEFQNPKNSYWKDAKRNDDNYQLAPTHWATLLEPPNDH